MTAPLLTPLEALRRLIAEVKQLDAAEVGERWNQLQGELGVAEGVVLNQVTMYGADEVVKAMADAMAHGTGIVRISHVPYDELASPAAAQPSEAAQQLKTFTPQRGDPTLDLSTCTHVMTMGNDIYVRLDEAEQVVANALSVATPPSAGSAAPAGEVDLSKLTRFGWTEAYIGDSSDLVEDPQGQYVKFADVAAITATKEPK